MSDLVKRLRLLFVGPKPSGDCLNCRSLTPAWSCREGSECTFKPIIPIAAIDEALHAEVSEKR